MGQFTVTSIHQFNTDTSPTSATELSQYSYSTSSLQLSSPSLIVIVFCDPVLFWRPRSSQLTLFREVLHTSSPASSLSDSATSVYYSLLYVSYRSVRPSHIYRLYQLQLQEYLGPATSTGYISYSFRSISAGYIYTQEHQDPSPGNYSKPIHIFIVHILHLQVMGKSGSTPFPFPPCSFPFKSLRFPFKSFPQKTL